MSGRSRCFSCKHGCDDCLALTGKRGKPYPREILYQGPDNDVRHYLPEEAVKGPAIKIDDHVYVDISLLRKIARKGRAICPDMIMYLCKRVEEKVAE